MATQSRWSNALGGVTLNTYDSNNALLSQTVVTSQGDLTTSNTYDQFGDPTSITNPDGTTTYYTYNTFGKLLTTSDSLGNTTRITYNSGGDPLTMTDAHGHVISFTYDSQGQISGMTDASGNFTPVTMSASGELLSETDPFGVTSTFTYESQGNQTGTAFNWVDPDNPSDIVPVTTSTAYNANGQIISTTDAEGHTTTTTYTSNGQVATTTDSRGNLTENTYDAAGNLIETRQSLTDTAGNTEWMITRSVYDADGRVIAQTDQYADGTTAPITGTLTTYDGPGDVVETQTVTGMVINLVGTGSTMRSVLSSAGTVVTTTTTQYDDQGREVSSTDQYGHETLTTYDDDGHVVDTRTQSVDQNGNLVWLVTQSVYNAQGQVELQTDQFQEGSSQPVDATETIYDSYGNQVESIRLQGVQVALVDPNNGQTVDPLDPGNSPIVSEVTNWGTELYSTKTVYNSLDQVVQSTAADGQTTSFEYDSFGRQTATIGQLVAPSSVGASIPAGDPAGTLVSLRTQTTYDAYGNTSSQTTNIYEFVLPNGSTQLDYSNAEVTQYQYDQFGNLVKTIYPDGSSTGTAYDSFGNKTCTTDQLGQTTQYEYDNENRLISVILPAVTNPATGQPTNPTYQYSYDAQGRQTSIADPNGGVTTFSYDSQGNELSRTLPLGRRKRCSMTARIARRLLSRSRATSPSRSTIRTPAISRKRSYPSLSAYDNGQGTPSETISYTYDAFGNVVETQDTVGSGSSAVTSTTTTTYDSQGNVLSVTSPQGTISYAYDNFGRLISTMIGPANAPTSVTNYTYNQLGQLWEVTVVEQNGIMLSTPEVTKYEYNLMGSLIEQDDPNGVVDQYSYDNMNQLTNETETGPSNTPIAEYDYTYRKDGLKATETDDFWFANNGQNVEVTNSISYTYDALDRLIDEAFTTNAEQILGYDSTLPSTVQQWERFNDEYSLRPRQQHYGRGDPGTGRHHANDQFDLRRQRPPVAAGRDDFGRIRRLIDHDHRVHLQRYRADGRNSL